MADNLSLTATVREGVGKGAAREARRNDLVPGIVYGGSEDPLNICLLYTSPSPRD